MNLEQGKILVKFARNSIASYFENKNIKLPEGFSDKQGVFVTLHSYPDKQLRGCIGFPEPIFALKEGIFRAARAAAFSDPRFRPLEKNELNQVIVEISVLTKPELIKGDYLKEIEIGKDGLIVRSDFNSGLLLPQVFPEWNVDVKGALEMTCNKAGLNKDCWKDKKCKFYKFQAEIFSENEPNGVIKREK